MPEMHGAKADTHPSCILLWDRLKELVNLQYFEFTSLQMDLLNVGNFKDKFRLCMLQKLLQEMTEGAQ